MKKGKHVLGHSLSSAGFFFDSVDDIRMHLEA